MPLMEPLQSNRITIPWFLPSAMRVVRRKISSFHLYCVIRNGSQAPLLPIVVRFQVSAALRRSKAVAIAVEAVLCSVMRTGSVQIEYRVFVDIAASISASSVANGTTTFNDGSSNRTVTVFGVLREVSFNCFMASFNASCVRGAPLSELPPLVPLPSLLPWASPPPLPPSCGSAGLSVALPLPSPACSSPSALPLPEPDPSPPVDSSPAPSDSPSPSSPSPSCGTPIDSPLPACGSCACDWLDARSNANMASAPATVCSHVVAAHTASRTTASAVVNGIETETCNPILEYRFTRSPTHIPATSSCLKPKKFLA